MGLFKKRENDLNKRWQEAYQANPRVYQNDEGAIIVACALTEDTDSLFPIVPEEQWAIKGAVIDKWIISIVSITKETVIGQIEYHEAMKRLKPYFLAVQDGWTLIGAMTLEQLDGLFEGLPRKIL